MLHIWYEWHVSIKAINNVLRNLVQKTMLKERKYSLWRYIFNSKLDKIRLTNYKNVQTSSIYILIPSQHQFLNEPKMRYYIILLICLKYSQYKILLDTSEKIFMFLYFCILNFLGPITDTYKNNEHKKCLCSTIFIILIELYF